jgi:aminoglycoside phosphotransferase (APT) family kinase protein
MTGLAPDPAVPRRDALLRPLTMAGILSRRLLGGVPVDRCELVHVKYRFGESLRAVYRFGDERYVAARTFPAETSEARYRAALEAVGPEPHRPGPTAGSPLPAVVHAPEVSAVLWVFPHDRRLAALRRLADPAALGCARTRLVAYAAERSATAQCLDARGEVVAYAKVHAAAAEEAGVTEAVGCALGDHPAVRVPRVLAADADLLQLEALTGRPLDGAAAPGGAAAAPGGAPPHATAGRLDGAPLRAGVAGPAALDAAHLERLGAALGALHSLPLPAGRFERLDPLRLDTAATIVTQARPDVARAAGRLLDRLSARAGDAHRLPVCLHGDANLRNALLLDDGRVGLIDLEHVAAGPAAADLGQLLAGLLVVRAQGGPPPDAAPLLAGYARWAEPPDRAALRWFTAASVLARIALPAVSRVRPDTLAHLRALLDAATDLVGRRVATGVGS